MAEYKTIAPVDYVTGQTQQERQNSLSSEIRTRLQWRGHPSLEEGGVCYSEPTRLEEESSQGRRKSEARPLVRSLREDQSHLA